MKKLIIILLVFLWVQVGFGQCTWFSIASGSDFSMAIKGDGTLWSWGRNQYGQLGNGTLVDKTTPTQIGTASDWQAVTCGFGYTLALKQNGTLWSWGNNIFYMLGLGNNLNQNIPTQIGTSSDWVKISASAYRSYGIRSNGTLWGWGLGTDNGLGFNDSQNKTTPAQLGTQSWKDISPGRYHVLAINSSDKLYSWGINYYGNLGNGTIADVYVPTQIGVENWEKISAGISHSLAIKSDGTLWAWGINGQYELGDGTTTQRLSPTKIGTANNWFEISADDRRSRGIQATGIFNRTIWGWGLNFGGSIGLLGAGVTSNIITPTQNGTSDHWYLISHNTSNAHSLWLDFNGDIYSSGRNTYGELGDGTTTNRNTLTPIGCGTVLPITLTSFTAKNQTTTNLLNWITENEINNQYFEIQHSLNGTNFKPIGKVNGQLNSSNIHSYNFTHNTPSNGINYYRLKQVDVDGKLSYSNIEQVKNNIVGITIYPNPVANGLFINGIKNNTPFSIINNVGQTILKDQYCTSKPIQTAAFATGIYFLKVENTVIKFMKE